MPRGVWSIEDPNIAVPGELVLDTSFVVEALLPAQPLHSLAEVYLERITVAGATIYFSGILEIELLEAVFKADLKRRHGSNHWQKMRHDGRARRPATRLMREVILAWNAALHALDFVVIDVQEVLQAVPDLMADYGLGSNDAVHTATAMRANVRAIVTLDAGFAAVPEATLQIYTDRSRLRVCRGYRK